eukprot:1790515-Alexandrium_andersonii.AAC.1
MGRRLDGRTSERAVSPCKHFNEGLVPAVPSKSVAAVKRACMGAHLVSHGKLCPVGQARVPGPSASHGREQHGGCE